MKVLQFTNTLHQGGAEAHILLLARGLKARGVSCEVAFLRSKVTGGSIDLRQRFEDAGIRTHYLACEHSLDPRAAIRLNRLLRGRPWDVVHSHLPRCDAAAALCKLALPRQAWVSTLHHPYNSADNAYSAGRWTRVAAPMWRLADGVIAVSETVRQWAIETLGLPAAQVRAIAHGIDTDAVGSRASEPPGAATMGHRIGSIGRYEWRKGHDTLIRAMPAILNAFPDAELRIAGHDPWNHGQTLRAIINDLGLERHVHLAGFVDGPSFLADTDVFAFASRSEGFGIVLLEAMAAAKPSVVSNIAPLNTIISPGTSGLVAECDDVEGFAGAIVSLFRDPGHARKIGDAARRRVEQEYSAARMVDNTLRYYDEVLRAG